MQNALRGGVPGPAALAAARGTPRTVGYRGSARTQPGSAGLPCPGARRQARGRLALDGIVSGAGGLRQAGLVPGGRGLRRVGLVPGAVGPHGVGLRRLTLEVYQRGQEIALRRGIIIADTKLEFGWAPDGTLVLADEVLTSDSSRFWPAESWQPGRPQRAFDKQVLRDWSRGLDWDRAAPGPRIPPEVVAATRQRYIEAYQRLTGTSWP